MILAEMIQMSSQRSHWSWDVVSSKDVWRRLDQNVKVRALCETGWSSQFNPSFDTKNKALQKWTLAKLQADLQEDPSKQKCQRVAWQEDRQREQTFPFGNCDFKSFRKRGDSAAGVSNIKPGGQNRPVKDYSWPDRMKIWKRASIWAQRIRLTDFLHLLQQHVVETACLFFPYLNISGIKCAATPTERVSLVRPTSGHSELLVAHNAKWVWHSRFRGKVKASWKDLDKS